MQDFSKVLNLESIRWRNYFRVWV